MLENSVSVRAKAPPLDLVISCFLLLASSARGEEPFMGPRVGLSDETAIVTEGQSQCAIIYPADAPEYLPLVARIEEAVEGATQVRLKAYPDGEVLSGKFEVADRFKEQHAILLGNLNNNRALVRLAANFYMYSTCAWPGANGYELRTVANPYGTKKNCIVLGGSDAGGVQQALEEFLKVIQASARGHDLIVPRLLKVVVGGKDQAELGPADVGAPAGPRNTYTLAAVLEAYNKTGSPARLKVARDWIGEYLKTGKSPAVVDYGTDSAVRGLDLVDTFAMSPEENQKMDNMLLGWVQDIVKEKPYWNPLGRKWSFGSHEMPGTLGFYSTINYLLKNGSPNEAARKLLEEKLAESREFLRYASTSFKDSKPDETWQTWTGLAVLPRYALATGDLTFFDSGTAANVTKRCFYAEQGFAPHFGPAALISFVFNDGQFKSVQPEGVDLGGWSHIIGGTRWMPPPRVKEESPSFLIGAKVLRSSPTDWEHAYRPPEKGTADWYSHLPWEKTFYLVGFADGVDKNDLLAVLGGWDSLGMPGEANSLRIFRDGGHRFLSGAYGHHDGKPRPGRFYKNTLVVNSGDCSAPPPCASELLAHHDGRLAGMTSIRLADYSGTDWDRCVFWRRGQYFAVLDVCTAKKAGPYSLTAQWWSGDVPGLEGTSWVAHTGKGAFRLAMSDAGSVSSTQWWEGGPYQLRQAKRVEAQEGQPMSFYNAFWVDGLRRRQSYEVRKAGPAAMMMRGRFEDGPEKTDEISLMGYATTDLPVRFGSLAIKAKLFFVSPGAVATEPGEALTLAGRLIPVSSGEPADRSDAGLLRTALEELWRALPAPAAEAAPPKAAAPGPATASFSLGERFKVAEPDYAPIGGVAFTKAPDGAVTWDLGAERKVTRIDGIRVDEKRVRVSFSSDNFKADVRTMEAEAGLRHLWVKYHYGWAADLAQGTLGPIEQVARYFRIEAPADKLSYGRWVFGSPREWTNARGDNSELFDRPFWQEVVFRSDTPQVRITRSLAADLDGDEAEEVIASTDNDDLVVLNCDGKPRWKHRLGGPVLNFICEDLERDRHREIMAACHDNFVYCFERTGELRFKLDLMADEEGMIANSLAVYEVGDGRRGLLLGTYNRCMKYDAGGKFIKKIVTPGLMEDAALPVAEDFNGDGVPDFVLRENAWGNVSLIDGKEFKPVARAETGYRGDGMAVVPWILGEGKKTNAVLVIAKQGVAMLSVEAGGGEVGTRIGALLIESGGGMARLFAVPISTITGWDIADLNGDGRKEIVLGTLYGAVVVLNEKGEILSSSVPATHVDDVAVVYSTGDQNPRLLVSTGSALVLYDAALELRSRQAVEGARCVKLQKFRSGNGSRSMCFFSDGTASALTCD